MFIENNMQYIIQNYVKDHYVYLNILPLINNNNIYSETIHEYYNDTEEILLSYYENKIKNKINNPSFDNICNLIYKNKYIDYSNKTESKPKTDDIVYIKLYNDYIVIKNNSSNLKSYNLNHYKEKKNNFKLNINKKDNYKFKNMNKRPIKRKIR